jgi:Protein of unknown function (DUF1045)
MTDELRTCDTINPSPVAPELLKRFGIYYTPDARSAVSRVWTNWLNNSSELKVFTTQPRKYGFHATLMAPFRLKPEFGYIELLSAVQEMAKSLEAVPMPAMKVVWLDSFLALRPVEKCVAIDQVAETCVRALDRLRAPLTEQELQRRLRRPLNHREGALLARWGYPFVMEQFRFHFTLSNELAVSDFQCRERLRRLASQLHAQTEHAWSDFEALSIVEQPHPEADFVVRDRVLMSRQQPR